MYEISPEPLNGFAPNLHGRRVWSLAPMSLKVKGQGHLGQKRHFSALTAVCVQFMFGKTSLASIEFCDFVIVDFCGDVFNIVFICLLYIFVTSLS